MTRVTLATAVAGLAYLLASSTSNAQTFDNLPAGTEVEGDYTGALRPRVHFSPPKGFMNDPNGMFRDSNGTWHLYYQYNPTGLVAGNQHWGHTTSTDLYHWVNQPIALAPPNATSGIFSGSAVLDPDNTSGFFPNTTDGVVAIYTLNTPEKQVQELAYSFDNGYSFTVYDGNPVLDVDSNQFRDPKVIWYEDHWVMVIAYSAEYVVGIYTSPDLKDWTFASNVTRIGLLGVQYECPNLVPLPVANSSETKYVLTISLNPGAPLGGSVTEYFPGSFNGTHFIPSDGATRLSNFAKDDYAGQFFYDSDVSIAWASNWGYTNLVPTADEGWRSAMTLPRKNYFVDTGVAGYELVQEIYDPSPILADKLKREDSFVNASTTATFSNAVYFDMNVTVDQDTVFPDGASINFTFTSDSGDKVSSGYTFTGATPYSVWINRGDANGFDNPFFTDKFSASQRSKPVQRIQGVMDRSLYEVYLDGGSVVGTSVVYPKQPFTKVEISTGGIPSDAQVTLEIWELEDVWAQ
ncbi:hypothetical protein IAU60_000528 [Kwoniella sp. DSM 27419]